MSLEEPENFKDLWDKLEAQELQLHAIEDLAQLLDQAKSVEESSDSSESRPPGPSSEQSTTQIDRLFQHVIGRIQEESKQDTATLAKRLVALNRLEKGFVSLLVARIDALEQRIHHLQREQSRLERVIHTSSQSILSRLFTGLRSQFQLKNVKAELRNLTEEKQRVWQKKEAFNQVRERLFSKSKAGARSVLQERRERGLYLLQDRLLEIIQEALEAAETSGTQHGFQLSDGSHSIKENRFGRFVRGLSPKEKAFIDKASDANSYAEGEAALLEELHSVIHEIHPDASSWLPNRCLFLGKLLAKQGEGCLVPTDLCVQTYKLFERAIPKLEAVQALLIEWPELARIRLVQLVRLIHRIGALNSKAQAGGEHAGVRKSLARIFRDLLISDCDVTAGMSAKEKPTPFERRRHQERVNRALDDMLRFMVDHADELGISK